ncbi:hypothetical protein ACH4VX_29060 [Streptomyces sp. NPDC020731]|uniref:hypothetical protein n=1 Tax=Streptomyces sp. NPDC020731 TaxID=3365085 RepID=UPI0037B0D62D
MTRTELFTRIRDVAAVDGAERWFTGDIRRSVPWLEAEEGRVSASQYYVVTGRGGAGGVLASCYRIPHTAAHRTYAPWDVLVGEPVVGLIGRLTRDDERQAAGTALADLRSRVPAAETDALAVVTPGCVLSGVTVPPHLSASQRHRELRELVAGVEELADAKGLPVVEFGHVGEGVDDGALRGVLAERGYVAVEVGADAVLDAHYSDLEEYFGSFHSHRRKVLRKERSRFLAEEPVVSVHGPDGLTADLVDLQLARYRRYGHAAHAVSVRDRFARAAAIPGLNVLRADSEAGAIGFVGFYEDRATRRIVPRLGAFAREGTAGYFNLAYYELVSRAARLGGMQIHYGDSTYRAKVSRGCRLTRLTTYLRAADPELHRAFADAAEVRTRLEAGEISAAMEHRGVRK